jgi:hypothetical protein
MLDVVSAGRRSLDGVELSERREWIGEKWKWQTDVVREWRRVRGVKGRRGEEGDGVSSDLLPRALLTMRCR